MDTFIKTDHFFSSCILLGKSVKKMPWYASFFNNSTPSLYVEVQYVKTRSKMDLMNQQNAVRKNGKIGNG